MAKYFFAVQALFALTATAMDAKIGNTARNLNTQENEGLSGEHRYRLLRNPRRKRNSELARDDNAARDEIISSKIERANHDGDVETIDLGASYDGGRVPSADDGMDGQGMDDQDGEIVGSAEEHHEDDETECVDGQLVYLRRKLHDHHHHHHHGGKSGKSTKSHKGKSGKSVKSGKSTASTLRPTSSPVIKCTPKPTNKPVTPPPSESVPVTTYSPTDSILTKNPTSSPNVADLTYSPTRSFLTKVPTVSPTTSGMTTSPIAPTYPPSTAGVTPTASPMQGTLPPTTTANTPTASPVGTLTASPVQGTSPPTKSPSSSPVTISTPPTASPIATSGTPTASPVQGTSPPTKSPSSSPVTISTPPTTSPTTVVGTPTASPIAVSGTPTASPVQGTLPPTPAVPSASVGPTSQTTSGGTFPFPPDSTYSSSFEQGDFPDSSGFWSTSGDASWTLDVEEANTGIRSIRSGALNDRSNVQKFSNVTFTTTSDFTGGSLGVHILADVEIPIDDVFYFVNDEFRGNFAGDNIWQPLIVPLQPGVNAVKFSYIYNPIGLDALPPPSESYVGAAFIDDVFLVSEGGGSTPAPNASGTPTASPVQGSLPTASPVQGTFPTASPSVPSGSVSSSPSASTRPSPGGSREPTSSDLPTTWFPTGLPTNEVSSGPTPSSNGTITSAPSIATSPSSSLSPSSVSSANGTSGSCIPFTSDDFESGIFPTEPWTTGGDGVWAIDSSQVFEGSYSIKSPDLEGSTAAVYSNATITTCEDFLGGVLRAQVLASVLPPSDIFIIYIDGNSAAQLVDVQNFTEVTLGIPPGVHTVDFSYRYNFFNTNPLPPAPPERLGAVWLDNVSIASAS